MLVYHHDAFKFFLSSGSFEIEVNGTLIHSRMMSNAFPDPDDVLAQIVAANNGGQPGLVTRYAE
jgi:predicted Rdx family selenoprotein